MRQTTDNRSAFAADEGFAAGKRAATAFRRTLLAALVVFAALAALAGPALAAPAVSATTSANNGYPIWYQDANGLRLEPCLDGLDAKCILPAPGEEPNYDPSLPTDFPTNFPSEFFYSVVDANTIDTPGCQGTLPGKALLRMAIEGAFANGAVVPGDQITFARIRVSVSSGLCPNTTYTFTHPYGVETLTTNAAGAIPKTAGTEDIGCLAVQPCDFSLALSSRVFGGFLRWDPAFAPAAPVGYLGDGVSLHRIVGSPSGTNFFRISQGSTTVGETPFFTVSGKLAGPLVSSPPVVAFGAQPVGTTSAPQTVTLTNVAAAPLAVSSVAVAGTDIADFVKGADTCTGVTLAQDASCTVQLSFAPTAGGARSAVLSVVHGGINSPVSVPLSGRGTLPAVSLSATSLAFSQTVSTTSAAKRVTVTNTGEAPLRVSSVGITGTNAADFGVVASTCGSAAAPAPVAPGASCTIDVNFAPSFVGSASASLDIASNAPASPHRVALSGNGTPATTIALSTTRLDFGGITRGSTTTKTLTIKNTGTANLIVSKLAIAGTNAAEFSIAQNGCAVATAPGRSCNINVTFRPAALGTRTATLTIASNANPANVALVGTAK